jgi:uncharacterized protein
LIQVLDLVVKLFVLTKRRFVAQRDHLSTRAPKEEAMAMKKIRSMVNSYRIDAISIGNGTSRETEFFIKKLLLTKLFKYL